MTVREVVSPVRLLRCTRCRWHMVKRSVSPWATRWECRCGHVITVLRGGKKEK